MKDTHSTEGSSEGLFEYNISFYYKDEKYLHPSVESLVRFFTYEHLPSHLQDISAPICEMAKFYARVLEGPELATGLRKLLEAKDCLVRAALTPTD